LNLLKNGTIFEEMGIWTLSPSIQYIPPWDFFIKAFWYSFNSKEKLNLLSARKQPNNILDKTKLAYKQCGWAVKYSGFIKYWPVGNFG
jgi:hypothetical protein